MKHRLALALAAAAIVVVASGILIQRTCCAAPSAPAMALPPTVEAAATPQEALIVVQWSDDSMPPADPEAYLREQQERMATGRINGDDVLFLEYALRENAGDAYVVDGWEAGVGTVNIFAYASDPTAAVRRIIQVSEQENLRAGMRIGLADGKNADGTVASYKPVYPAGLDRFEIRYPAP